ncbi:hypothetical protein, partial [Enterobacter hormaechei]
VDAARIGSAAARLEDALARPFVVGGDIAPLGARLVTGESQAGDNAAALLRRTSEALLGDVPREKGAPPVDLLVDNLHR